MSPAFKARRRCPLEAAGFDQGAEGQNSLSADDPPADIPIAEVSDYPDWRQEAERLVAAGEGRCPYLC